MADINPKKRGDLTYSQEPFWRVTTLPIKISVTVTKGKLMTIDTAGRLVAIPVAVGGVVPVTLGIFQPLADVSPPSAEDTDFVQVVTMGSRILMTASVSGLSVGNPVKINSPTATTTDAERVELAARTDLDRLGTIFEIYTRTSSSTKKYATTANTDLVIVETGMF